MMKFEQYSYILPVFWAPVLINDDYSGMDDDDVAVFDNWVRDNSGDMELGHWGLDSDQEASFYTYHDAHGYVLACNCFEYIWNKRVGNDK